ncbi:phage tail length tape measure family protein [Pseudomonas guariconensis]|uniref:phage tail length tape measure family protein n=1 Tax=Pseudomonas guariconensis TaxID=1288410 RepID=UPI0018AA3A2D|nr:phage tail length tape measure family protein [Pseudomonas guariconensis]MBF8755520.1 phage tail length tape measure family protein [Pseudomonas guariconensis]
MANNVVDYLINLKVAGAEKLSGLTQDLKQASSAMNDRSLPSGESAMSQALKKITDTSQVAGGQLATFGGHLDGLVSGIQGVGIAAGVSAAVIGAALSTIAFGLANISDDERKLGRLEALLKSTGGAAGFSAQQLADFASEKEKATLFDGGAIQDASGALLGFTSIVGDMHKKVLSLAIDMAEVMGGEVRGQVVSLGKAFEDPINGLASLSKQGVKFTDEQKELIATLIDSGEQLKAQDVLYEALKEQLGEGAAEGANNSLSGRMKNARLALKDLAVEFTNFTNAPSASAAGLDVFTEKAGWLVEKLKDLSPAIDAVKQKMLLTEQAQLIKQINTPKLSFMSDGTYEKQLLAYRARLMTVNQEIYNLQDSIDQADRDGFSGIKGITSGEPKPLITDADKNATLAKIKEIGAEVGSTFAEQVKSATTPEQLKSIEVAAQNAADRAAAVQQKANTAAKQAADKLSKEKIEIAKTEAKSTVKAAEDAAAARLSVIDREEADGTKTARQAADARIAVAVDLNNKRAAVEKQILGYDQQILDGTIAAKETALAALDNAAENAANQFGLAGDELTAKINEIKKSQVERYAVEGEINILLAKRASLANQEAALNPLVANQNASDAINNRLAIDQANAAKAAGERAAAESKRKAEEVAQRRRELQNEIAKVEIEAIRLTGKEREAAIAEIELKYKEMFRVAKGDAESLALTQKLKDAEVANERVRLDKEAADKRKQYEQEVADVRIKLLRLSGKTFEADLAEIDRNYSDLLRKMGGSAEDLDLVKKLIDAEKVKAELDEVLKEMERLQEALANGEMSRQEYSDRMKGVSDKANDLAGKTGDQDTIDSVRRKTKFATSDLQDLYSLGQKVGAGLNNAFDDAFEGLIDGSAKASDVFKDFASDMAFEISKLIVKSYALYAIQSLLGLVGGGAGGGGFWSGMISGMSQSMGAQTLHDGGAVTGGGWRKNLSASLWTNAPRFHNGGAPGLASDEVAAVLQKGEYVMSKNDPDNPLNGGRGNGGGGSGGQQLVINNLLDTDTMAGRILDSQSGQKGIMNFITDNATAIKAVLNV